ncbi:MAG TPA: hypothetical protein VK916_06480, partial [Gillisia sp.]|nr:hypothetical protein [Gillisia sp.]
MQTPMMICEVHLPEGRQVRPIKNNKYLLMKKVILGFLACNFIFSVYAQENLTYQKPPQEILELVDVPLAPST